DKDVHDIEVIWPALAPPYRELFAWLEGRAERPASGDPASFRPPMLAHALDDADLAALKPEDFMAEWKWDGIRVHAAAGRLGTEPQDGNLDGKANGKLVARLYSRTGEEISKSF